MRANTDVFLGLELEPAEELRYLQIVRGDVRFPKATHRPLCLSEQCDRAIIRSLDGGMYRILPGPKEDEVNSYAFCGLCITRMVDDG